MVATANRPTNPHLTCDVEKFSFCTRRYKGLFIHSHTERAGGKCRDVVTWQDEHFNVKPATSWRAAQLAITKHQKENQNGH